MLTELRSAIGQVLPRANYVDAGTLGISNIDASTKLDPVIAERLSSVNRTAGVLSRAQAVAFDLHQEALRALKNAEANRDRFIKDYEQAHHAVPEPDQLAHLEREVTTARAAANSADIAVSAATTRSAGTRTALSAAVKFLNDRTRSGKTIKVAKVPKLTGVPSTIVIEQRQILRALDDDLHDIELALVPVQDAVNAIRMKVALLAAGGRPRISVSARGADIDLASTDYMLLAQGQHGQVPIAQPDAVAFTAWLLEDALAGKAEQAVRDSYETDTPSLSASERSERIASVHQRRLAAETLEVAAVLRAWSSGDYSIALRADTDPAAVLGIFV